MNAITARLDLRLSPADKQRIVKAATLRGLPVSTFVRSTLLREAETALAAEAAHRLSEAETHHFLAALDAPFQPNSRLQNAMNRATSLTEQAEHTNRSASRS
ncbi:MAG: DUF1778 domain-containing protein [Lautropia sp.]|nr:DUF1778 domain-containing protein [Lautropia sp.]